MIEGMLRRLFRRTFEPRRPLVYEGSYALVVLTAIVLVGSIALVAWVELR
jgi:hypothetical protein